VVGRNALFILTILAHDLTYRGLCASCGVDTDSVITRKNIASVEQLSLSLDWIVPGFCGLQANSSNIIQQIFKQDYTSMLEKGKLRLVLDMDETFLHSVKTQIVDPQSLASIPQDSLNNFSFSLSQNSVFTVFLRPHLGEFLTNVSKHFEIYIYTNGTDGYAKTIYHQLQRIYPSCNIQAIFTKSARARVTAKKQLHKMLCKRTMSLIVDDRPDVWCDEDAENIIPIKPFKCNLTDLMNYESAVYNDQELVSLQNYLIKLHEKYITLAAYRKVDVRQVLKQYTKEEFEEEDLSDMDSDDDDMNDDYESDASDEEEDDDEDENLQ
jgi:hypothetical protein